MKNRKSFPVISLVIVLAVALGVCRIIRVCAPFAVLPKLDIPNTVLLCGVALLLDHLFSGKAKSFCWTMPVLAAVAFGLLPFAAGFAASTEIVKLALTGGIVFGLTAWIYESMADRMMTGPAAKAAPVLSVFGLYLAAQCFMNIIL